MKRHITFRWLPFSDLPWPERIIPLLLFSMMLASGVLFFVGMVSLFLRWSLS